jgi:predicted AAA+ superfamily ATPase
MNIKTIKLNENEIWPLLNVLNEVCHGIRVDNFKGTIGEKKEIVLALMDKIAEEENKEATTIDLNDSELKILEKSFEEVFKQIDEWEFQTRVGISIHEATQIKNKLKAESTTGTM